MISKFWPVLTCLLCGTSAAFAAPLTLDNGKLLLEFDEATGGLTRIQRDGAAQGFIRGAAEKPLLWQLVLRNSTGEEHVIDNTQAGPPSIEKGPEMNVKSLTETATPTLELSTTTLHWNDVDLPGETDTLDVSVACQFFADSDTALLRLRVDNTSTKYGLWLLHFPIIAPLGDAKSTNIAVGRGTWGMLYPAPQERLSGEYPANNWPMQFLLALEGGEGLYLAAHDAQAMYKKFEVQTGADLRIIQRAVDMGVPGNDWTAPYPYAVGVYQGDWMDGCKRFRTWAEGAAPWLRKGPLAKRKDVPERMRRVCAWLLGGGTREDAVPKVKQFAEAIGAPVGVHWYNWHEIPFDTYYPNYFPTKPGFAEGVKELTDAGIVVMPYINARLWDTQNENFAEAKPHSAKNEKGEVTIEEYGSGAKLAVMCPNQHFWQHTIEDIVRRLGQECGVNAVYLDQIASAPPRVCFDASHGHPLGSGSWWVDGYRQMLGPIKNFCTSGGRQIGLTTENDADAYMDNVDAHLIWTPRSQDDIPMMTAVYSGHSLYFASNRTFFTDDGYALCQARDFTWGAQLGWDGVDILAPEHAAKLEILGRLARLREKLLEFFVYGELLEVLPVPSDVPTLTGTWNTPKGDAPVTLPAVHATLWRARDGRVALIAANAAPEAQTIGVTLPADLLKDSSWQVRQLNGAPTELPSLSASTLQVTISPRDGNAIILSP
ncbi:MAG: hypothetical protein HYZ00_11475 [Candidatus Hydrogenedentes bacterium]|nr:hypothetical protein [Candidatus Hydrogenedentota bacterium]